jgi:hypothetical protein
MCMFKRVVVTLLLCIVLAVAVQSAPLFSDVNMASSCLKKCPATPKNQHTRCLTACKGVFGAAQEKKKKSDTADTEAEIVGAIEAKQQQTEKKSFSTRIKNAAEVVIDKVKACIDNIRPNKKKSQQEDKSGWGGGGGSSGSWSDSEIPSVGGKKGKGSGGGSSGFGNGKSSGGGSSGFGSGKSSGAGSSGFLSDFKAQTERKRTYGSGWGKGGSVAPWGDSEIRLFAGKKGKGSGGGSSGFGNGKSSGGSAGGFATDVPDYTGAIKLPKRFRAFVSNKY